MLLIFNVLRSNTAKFGNDKEHFFLTSYLHPGLPVSRRVCKPVQCVCHFDPTGRGTLIGRKLRIKSLETRPISEWLRLYLTLKRDHTPTKYDGLCFFMPVDIFLRTLSHPNIYFQVTRIPFRFHLGVPFVRLTLERS